MKSHSEFLQPAPLKRCFSTSHRRTFSSCCLPGFFFLQNPPSLFCRAKRQTRFLQTLNGLPIRYFSTSKIIPSYFSQTKTPSPKCSCSFYKPRCLRRNQGLNNIDNYLKRISSLNVHPIIPHLHLLKETPKKRTCNSNAAPPLPIPLEQALETCEPGIY